MSNYYPSFGRREGDFRIVSPRYKSGILRRFTAVLSLRFSKKKLMPSGVFSGGCSVLHSRLLPQLPKLIFSSNFSANMNQRVQVTFQTENRITPAGISQLTINNGSARAAAIALLLMLLQQVTGFSQGVSFSATPGSVNATACTSPSVSFSGTVNPSSTLATSANFNSGSLPSGWSSTNFTTSACSNNSPDNSAYWWGTTNDGNSNRWVSTGDLNVSLGGRLDYYIRYGSASAPCETLDSGEGVVLQYSTNGGGSWTTFYNGVAGGVTSDAWYTGWYSESITIPTVAQTSSTRFRWIQLSNSGDPNDHWGLEDINVYANVPSLTINSWSWNFGDGGTATGQNVTHSFPNLQGTNNYTVTLTAVSNTNQTYTSTSTYTVNISGTNPTSGGTIAGAQCGASGFNPAAMTSLTLPSGESGALEYKWQQSTTSATTGFVDLGSSNSTTYDPGAVGVNTWFRRLARVVCKTDWTGAAESNVILMSIDATAPVLTCPANITADNNTTSSTFAVTYGATTASDNCLVTATPALTSGIASGGAFPYGTTTNIFSVTDNAGNTGTCSFTVFVQQALPASVNATAAT